MKFLFFLLVHIIAMLIVQFCRIDYCNANTSKIDTLLNEFKRAKADTIKINLYLKIGELYENINTDSALYYYNISIDIAQNNINSTKDELQNKYYFLKADALRYIGIVYDSKGNYTTSLDYFYKSIKIYEALGSLKNNSANKKLYKRAAAYCYGNIALVLTSQSEFLKAIEYFRKSLNTCKELGDKMGEAYCYSNLGLVELNRRNFDEAINFLQKSIRIKEKLNDKYGIMESYNILGVVYKYMANYPLAIYYYQESLKIGDELDDKKNKASCYNNIGMIHNIQGNYFLSIEYLQKATVIFDQLGNKKGVASSYINIGVVYEKIEKYNLAIEFENKALKISEEIDDKNTIISCLSNIGINYEKQGDYSKAIEYYTKSLNVSIVIHDRVSMSFTNISIANVYKTLADSSKIANEKKQYYNKAISLALNALEIAEKIGTINQVNDASLCLMLCNISIGNNVEAQKYAKLYISSRDSMYINDRLKALAEMEALYQTEKKQLQINNLKNEKNLQSETIARKDAENKKQRLLTYTFIVSFIVILLFSIILYRQFSAKKRANSLLSIKNIEITQKSEEITLQRDEIEDHRIKLSNQNSLLSEQKKKITDSINYAKRIQQAVLSIGEFLSNINLEHFVLFKPKDIVSGDFYWGTKINELNIIAVADCTGHGVPGAFMSMLGVSFLNEIVRKNEVIQTNLVLDELRKSIIESLQQKGNDDEQKDGFDIVLCVINSQTNELQFSGAYNPLYIINFEKQLIELIADKQPVGIHDNMTPFDCQSVKLNNGDCIYLSSDGYVDQIGGTNYKKFLSKNLKQLLIANCQLPMQEQKNILEKTLVDWIGDGEQIDDITLLGIRI